TQRTGLATVLSLNRLDKAAVQEFIQRAHLPSPLAIDALRDRLYQESEGLPLFIAGYLEFMANGTLPLDAQVWQLPAGSLGLFRSRLAPVSEAGHQLLHAASVIGRSFDFEILREASGRSEDECISALEELLTLGLIEEIKDHTPAADL